MTASQFRLSLAVLLLATSVGAGVAPAAAQATVPGAVSVFAVTGAQGAPSAYLRSIITAESTGAMGDRERRLTAVSRFYAQRHDAPLWIAGDAFTDRAREVMSRIARAAEDGLNPTDFVLPDPNAPIYDPQTAATEEVKLSLAVVSYAEEASGGRVSPASISRDNIARTPQRIAGAQALAAAAGPGPVDAVFDDFNPPERQFQLLKAKLAETMTGQPAPTAEPAVAEISFTGKLRPGMSDFGVQALRERLGLPEVADPALSMLYDPALMAAVQRFQREHGLAPDGVIGARTLDALNGRQQASGGPVNAADIVANMEMWRWMPRDLSSDYIFVNIPEYKVRVYRQGSLVHEARVVVGAPKHETPVFSDQLQYLVVNPYWNVPESIKIKEMLPEIQADPAGYFRRHGYEATWDGQVIDPSRVIWDENAVRAVGIRQVPGEANALGNIKFMFPNKFAVYLHDTPLRNLFNRDARAFSHGCVRVDDPMSFAAAILEGDPQWTVDQLQAKFGGPEQRIDISNHPKVHLSYFTVWVDDSGNVRSFGDVYGYEGQVKSALGLSPV